MHIAEAKAKLLQLLKTDAFFREKITLSSGKQSDFYIDARRVTLHPEGAYLCGRIIYDMIKDDAISAIGGPTLGADPMLGAIGVISYQEHKPVNTFIIRKAPKPYGKQQQIEGPLLRAGSRVVVIDDVATSGKSIIQSLEVLKPLNVTVVKAICIVDRREGAAENLAPYNCKLQSIFTLADINV